MDRKIIGQTFRYMRNKIFAELLQSKNIIKALTVESEDFLNAALNKEQLSYIDNPTLLVRKYMYPYKKIFDTATEHRTILSMQLSNFQKRGNNYRDGLLTIYVLTPINLENTAYGIRYDYICDEIEEIFNDTQIGEFNFYGRGDIDIGDRYIGHYVSFKITDFHISKD
jgi:hypothetical protein